MHMHGGWSNGNQINKGKQWQHKNENTFKKTKTWTKTDRANQPDQRHRGKKQSKWKTTNTARMKHTYHTHNTNARRIHSKNHHQANGAYFSSAAIPLGLQTRSFDLFMGSSDNASALQGSSIIKDLLSTVQCLENVIDEWNYTILDVFMITLSTTRRQWSLWMGEVRSIGCEAGNFGTFNMQIRYFGMMSYFYCRLN